MWWLVAAVGLGIPLVLTAMPEFAMLSVGALAGALTAWLGAGLVPQVLVFAVVSVAGVAAVRPIAARHRKAPPARSGVEALKGQTATVLETVDRDDGRIKLGGEVWSARTLEAELTFDVGRRVDVVEIRGATAIVM